MMMGPIDHVDESTNLGGKSWSKTNRYTTPRNFEIRECCSSVPLPHKLGLFKEDSALILCHSVLALLLESRTKRILP